MVIHIEISKDSILKIKNNFFGKIKKAASLAANEIALLGEHVSESAGNFRDKMFPPDDNTPKAA